MNIHTQKHIPSSAVVDHAKSTAVSYWGCMLMLSWSASSLTTSFSQYQQAVNHRDEKWVCKCVCMCVIEGIDETVRNSVEHVHHFFLSLFLYVALLFSLFLSEVSLTLSSVSLYLLPINVPKYRHTGTYCCCFVFKICSIIVTLKHFE